MPARPPQWGLEQPPWPPGGEEPTATAWLDIRQRPVDGEGLNISGGKQVTPATPKPIRRITTTMRGAKFGAALRMAVPPGDASQMIAAFERITVSLIWAVAITVTLAIATAASLSAGTVIAITGLALAGFAITLIATRWRRRRDRLGPSMQAVRAGTRPGPAS